MASFDKLLQNYVNKSYDELLSLAKYSMSQFIDTLVEQSDSEGAAKVCALITAACLGADAKLSYLEHKFFNDLLDSDDDYFENLEFVSGLGNDKAREMTDRLVDSLSDDEKAAAVSFCLCFLAVDETISRDEVAFIARLID